MERTKEDEEAHAARAAELNSLVCHYLRTVDASMADAFRERTKARERTKEDLMLEDFYDCYQKSKSCDHASKRTAEQPVNILHNVSPKRNPQDISHTELHTNKVAVPAIECRGCDARPGPSNWKPGEELVRTNIIDPLPESTPQATAAAAAEGPEPEEPQQDDYRKTLELEAQQPLLPNINAFTCCVCMNEIGAGKGVMLRECLHTLCHKCLGNLVRHCDEAIVVCPYRLEGDVLCGAPLEDREVRALVSDEEYGKRLQKSVQIAERNMLDAFHCRSPDCLGWCVRDKDAKIFLCPLCKHRNCLTCKAIHEGENCEEYMQRVIRESSQGADGAKNIDTINKMIKRKAALACRMRRHHHEGSKQLRLVR